MDRRSCHWVFKVPHRPSTFEFYNALGTIPLRHEEFTEGCEAACNGPYDGHWSKTMVGYGPEDTHFVFELTYNYGLREYDYKSDLLAITIKSKAAVKAIKANREAFTITKEDKNGLEVEAPGGYPFVLLDEDVAAGADPVQSVTLASSDTAKTVAYWSGLLDMSVVSQDAFGCTLSYGDGQAQLKFVHAPIRRPVWSTAPPATVEHGTAAGRICFGVPRAQLPGVQKMMTEKEQAILTPLVTLPTPGKADVDVVIMADHDGYEICFVGDEAFRELSAVDPKAQELLQAAIDKDESDKWHEKQAAKKIRMAAIKAKREANEA